MKTQTRERLMIIRRAETADAEAIMRINVNTWRQAYQGLLPDDFLAARGESPERLARIIKNIAKPENYIAVAEAEDGKVVGYIWGGKGRKETIPCPKEVYAFYVNSDDQRKGVGKALWESFRDYAEGACFYVCVLKGNRRGEGFYRHQGGRHNQLYDLIQCHDGIVLHEEVYFFDMDLSGGDKF